MSEDVIPGVNSANTREYKIRQFLAKPPKRAEKLVLVASEEGEGEPSQLAEWERDEVQPQLATTIVEMLDEHAIEMGGAVRCVLAWVDGNGKPVATLQLKRQASHIEGSADLTQKMLQGDSRSLVVAAQAQSLQLQRMYMSSMQGVLAASERLARREEDRVEELYRRLAKAELENEALRQALTQAEALVSAADSGEPINAAQSQALDLLKQLAPMLMQRLLAPTAATPHQA